MRRVFALVLGGAVLGAGCAQVGGQISGDVVVASGYADLGVYAALWQVPASPSDPNDPISNLVATGATPTFIGYLALGVAGTGGSFPYTFHSLDRGLYLVGAFLDNGESATPNLETDVHDIDLNNTIQINPQVKSETSATENLYLGESAPGSGTIAGTLHLSAQAATVPISVLLLSSNPYTSANPTLIDQLQVTGGGADIPYTIYNAPTTPVFVVGWADTNQNGQIDFDADEFAFAGQDPVAVSTSAPTTGIDLWIGAQSPSLGSIQGTISLTAPLTSCTVSVLAFSSNYTTNQDANVVAVVNVTGSMTDMVPFQLTSLPLGTTYLYAITQTPALSGGGTVTGQTEYSNGTPGDLLPVRLTSSQMSATNITFPVGVGRVSGTVQIKDAPADVTDAWVTATQTVQGGPQVLGLVQLTLASGNQSISYELFGLLDGTFDMTFVPDLMMTGSLSEDVNDGNTGVAGDPSAVTIVQASPEQSNFAYSFQQGQ